MDISKIQTTEGSILDIKDAIARQTLNTLIDGLPAVPSDPSAYLYVAGYIAKVYPAGAVSTIHIDESNSETGSKVVITGDLGKDAISASSNVIRWIRDNSKLYIGKYSEKLGHLAVMDISNIEDYDSDWALNDKYNQYMKLPKFWYRCTNTETGADIQFTHDSSIVDDSWNCWDGDTFIGCYKAHAVGDTTNIGKDAELSTVDNVSLVSHPNTMPSTRIAWQQFRDITRKMGKGFSMVTYEAHKIMEILFYAWYGEVDAQLICGKGASVNTWHYENNGVHENGRIMDAVTDFTDTNADDDSDNNHFWGLCDWWGNVYEWIDNLQILGYDSNNTIDGDYASRLAILDYDGKPIRVFDDIAYVDDCQTKKYWDKYADVIPTEVQGIDNAYDNTGYTVYGYINADTGSVAMRSCSSASSGGGVGYLALDDSPDYCYNGCGSRLQYTGKWAEVSNFNSDYAFVTKYDIATIIIDESDSDGYNKVNITGDLGKDGSAVSLIRNGSKLYIGKYNSDYKKMLMKPFNSSNTTWTSIDGASLFMRLPEFWYKCYNTSTGCIINLTMKKEYIDDSWNHWDGNKFIACYKAELAGDSSIIAAYKSGGTQSTDDIYFESKPGKKPSTFFSQKQGKQIARNMGDGFSLITYEAHKIMEILFYAYYGNVDAQAVCGAGATVSSWDNNSHLNGRILDVITSLGTTTTRISEGSTVANVVISGSTRTAVFGNSVVYNGTTFVFNGNKWSKSILDTRYDTVASSNPTNNHFWGLCDWWGNVYEWIDNLQILGYGPDGSDDHINVGVLDKDNKLTRIIDATYIDGYPLTKKVWGKYADTIPNGYTEDYDEYSDAGYTVNGYVRSDFGDVAERSYDSDNSGGGVGYLYVDDSPGARSADLGSRLFYDGDYVITSDLEP